MDVKSVCTECEHQNPGVVDHDGHGRTTCSKCKATYKIKTYQVRAKSGRRVNGVKNYRVRVKEPDKDETLLEFASSGAEIEMRSGDWITGSFDQTGLRHIINHTIGSYWTIQMPVKSGCIGGLLVLFTLGFLLLMGGRAYALQPNDSFQQAKKECAEMHELPSARDEVKFSCSGLQTEFGVRDATLTFDLNGTLTGLTFTNLPGEGPLSLRSALEAEYGPPRDETYYQTRWVTQDRILILELADYNGGRVVKTLTRKRPSAVRSVFVGSCTNCWSSPSEESSPAAGCNVYFDSGVDRYRWSAGCGSKSGEFTTAPVPVVPVD